MNFISPYVELPKNSQLKKNLIVYGKMYEVKNLKERIEKLTIDLNSVNFKIERQVNYHRVRKIGFQENFNKHPRNIIIR